ncbi:Urease accessory protein UreE 1 [Pseudovibrio axinellae]|uniref:Urease accessory protein UreE n=1 Tax=Pseudovibrio axinellae TaxID=989403 RepID=A0A161VD06_9HYPH|nr:urease accessory protein UreE [Pseudovibrio axinellae]KZL22124.1 Urease accessory protein UreE 1 [Pseudovibrio axinellae]SEQ54313.1 urease accessory protein [Pseudovibrio axinellae]
MKKATSFSRVGTYSGKADYLLYLAHYERHVRRKRLVAACGTAILVDLPESVVLSNEDVLVLENGEMAMIAAQIEPLYKVTTKDNIHFAELCWHLGNRHLPAQIQPPNIYIGRDHVIKQMLEGLGATLEEVEAPFSPVHGAYHKHKSHSHAHAHD